MAFPDPLNHPFPEWIAYGDFMYYGPDIISLGDPLTVSNLESAYSAGIFPWYMEGIPLPWFCPRKRAVLFFDELHIPRSLMKERRKGHFYFTIDKAFRDVMLGCARSSRPDQGGTWITPDFVERYTALHEQGFAHSVEAWTMDGELAGGLYGVDAGGVFCGESMFYLRPNASKLALLFLIDQLTDRGSTWLDCQVMTPHFKVLGAKEIDRADFMVRLKKSQELTGSLF